MSNDLNFSSILSFNNDLEFFEGPTSPGKQFSFDIETGEISFVLDIQQSVLILPSAYTGEYSSVTALVSPPRVEFDSPIYSGEETLFDLSAFNNLNLNIDAGEETLIVDLTTESSFDILIDTGETVEYFDIETIPAIDLDIVDVYSSECLELIDLVTSVIIDPQIESGEELFVDLTTYIVETISVDIDSGEFLDTDLSTQVIFNDVDIIEGQNLDLDLIIYPIAILEIECYSGESVETVFDITPITEIEIDIYSGESNEDIQLGTSLLIDIAYDDGSELLFDLECDVNLGIPLLIESGESFLDLDISTEYNLPLDSDSGEFVLSDLAVEITLDILSYSGEEIGVDLIPNPPCLLIFDIDADEYLTELLLATETILPNKGFSGENFDVDFTDSSAAPFEVIFYSDSSSSTTMQSAFQIPVDYCYSGEWVTVSGMETEPNWIIVTGTSCDINLSTSSSFIVEVFSGQSYELEIDEHPSEPLGELEIFPGEWVLTAVNVVYSANFRVLFRTSIMTQVDIRSATYFDLSTDLCCGERPRSNNLNFIIEKGQYPEEVSYGNRVSMEVDLRTNARMQVEFPTGHVAELIDKSAYFEISFAHESNHVEIDWEADLKHKMCKGYFIPTGDWVVVEMRDLLPEDCYANRLYSGEVFSCALSDDQVLRVPENPIGAILEFEMRIDPPLLLFAGSGEVMTLDFPLEARLSHYAGERMSIRLYEPPFIIFSGTTLSLEMQTEYGVRFLEDGCLDNEFVFQTDDGDAIPELFNPVPVEGEPYKHDIKAECF